MIDAACFTSPPNKKKEQAASTKLSNSVVLSAAHSHKRKRKCWNQYYRHVGTRVVTCLIFRFGPPSNIISPD
jgi:hypothetical protein